VTECYITVSSRCDSLILSLLPGYLGEQTVSSIFPKHSVQDVVSLQARNIIAALNSGPIRAPPSSTSIKLHRLAVMLTSHPRHTKCYWC